MEVATKVPSSQTGEVLGCKTTNLYNYDVCDNTLLLNRFLKTNRMLLEVLDHLLSRLNFLLNSSSYSVKSRTMLRSRGRAFPPGTRGLSSVQCGLCGQTADPGGRTRQLDLLSHFSSDHDPRDFYRCISANKLCGLLVDILAKGMLEQKLPPSAPKGKQELDFLLIHNTSLHEYEDLAGFVFQDFGVQWSPREHSADGANSLFQDDVVGARTSPYERNFRKRFEASSPTEPVRAPLSFKQRVLDRYSIRPDAPVVMLCPTMRQPSVSKMWAATRMGVQLELECCEKVPPHVVVIPPRGSGDLESLSFDVLDILSRVTTLWASRSEVARTLRIGLLTPEQNLIRSISTLYRWELAPHPGEKSVRPNNILVAANQSQPVFTMTLVPFLRKPPLEG